MKKIFFTLMLLSTLAYSQSVKVLENKLLTGKISEHFYHPHFSGDNNHIIFTKANYNGLYSLNLKTKKFETITNEKGAGYKPLIYSDGKTILYRPYKIKKGLKYNSIKTVSLKNKKIKTIESFQRELSVPNQMKTNKILYLKNYNLKEIDAPNNSLSKLKKQNKAVFVKNNSLYFVNNGKVIELSPFGKGIYVWASLSKDGNKILFSFANKGAYVCDIKGNILFNIKDAHYPKFSPDAQYISYMIDKDNGDYFTSSDLYIYSLKENKSYKITDTNDKIEMYADWSHDGKKLVYQTTEGEIYLMKLDIKN